MVGMGLRLPECFLSGILGIIKCQLFYPLLIKNGCFVKIVDCAVFLDD